MLRFSLVLILFIPFLLRGQTNPYGEVSIASPTAASLGKYADIPVSYHTGIPQIDIPIYTIQAGSLSLPISISYHASGLKVIETSSWVGAGWALNAGGVITRSVVGLPDESNTGCGAVDLYGYYSDSGYNKYINKDFPFEDWNGFAQGRKDGEPDLFFFNFGGYSGKFFFRDDRTPILVPQQDIRIIPYYPNPGYQSIQGFTVITPDGTKYYFGNTPGFPGTTPPIEMTNPFSSETGYVSGTALSSWFLNKIVSADGLFSILLSYTPESYGYYTLSSTPMDTHFTLGAHEFNLVKNIINGVRLSQISFPNGTVSFIPGQVRTDLSDNSPTNIDNVNTSAKTLGSISISNTSTNNLFCKKFIFNYGYFSDNITPLPSVLSIAGFNLQTDKNRLRLDSVNEMSCDSLLKIPARKFQYFSELVPRRINLGIDHWGFYNGVTSNQTLVPTYSTYDGVTTTLIPGGDRNSVWPAMRGGSLQQMTYPTGGSTLFDFEPGDSYTNSTASFEPVQMGSSSVHLYSQNTKYNDTITLVSNGNPITPTTFNNTADYQATIVIKDSRDSVWYNNASIGDNNYPTGQTGVQFPASLPAGTYKAILHLPNGPGPNEGASVIYSQLAYVVHPFTVTIGGLRVKTISNKTSPGDLNPVITNYSYPNGAYVYSSPVYIQHLRNDVVYTLGFWSITHGFWKDPLNYSGCPVTGGFYKKGGGSLRPMTTTQGYHMGFPVVKVSQTGNGYSVYNYYTSNSGFSPQTFNPAVQTMDITLQACESSAPNYPPAPPPFESRRGELYYEQHYNESGQILKDIFYYPEFDSTTQQPTPGFITATLSDGSVLATYYSLASPRRKKMHTVETNFAPGIGGIQADNYIYYGSPYHNQETRKVTYTSKGDSLITNTKYAADFHLSSWDVSPTCDVTYANTCSTCLVRYNSGVNTCNGNSVCITDSFLLYRRCLSDARNLYVNCHLANDNTYKANHNASKASAGSELKPILELQDSNRILPIEISNFRNGKLLKANFTRYDYVTSPSGIPFPNKTQLVSVQSPSSSFTNAVISGTTITKDSRYLDESSYSFLYGNPIRVTGHDGMNTLYIWDYINTNPIAKTISPVIDTTAFTSFEADGKGNWNIQSALRDTLTAITGMNSYKLSNGNITKTGLTTGKKYTVSFWCKNGTCSLTGGTINTLTGRIVNGWTYFENAVTTTGSTLTISGTGNIDELRMYPQGAQMTSYTYKPQVGITTVNDPNSEITYYEYDALARLKNIKDYQGNIIKNNQYNYLQKCTSCAITMKTLAGTATLSYPVGVFSVANKLLGNATTPAQYISLWNGDAANHIIGTLTAGADSMHFNLSVNSGQVSPGYIIGCRFFQYDLAYSQLDGVRNSDGAFVDFGDGTNMPLGKTLIDSNVLRAPSTILNVTISYTGSPYIYWIHTYPNSNLKTITFYHNDDIAAVGLDNAYTPATSLTLIKNFRGNIPQFAASIGGSCYQQSTATSVSNIINWNKINSINKWVLNLGDGVNPCMNIGYGQDFMAGNINLKIISATYGSIWQAGYRDITFKLSRLKSNWNTYFTQLSQIFISDEHWNREDLSGLLNLQAFVICAGNQNHSNIQSGNTVTPIPSSAIDNIINQISAGAGRMINNGTISILSGGTSRTTASDNGYNNLISKGWTINIITTIQ